MEVRSDLLAIAERDILMSELALGTTNDEIMQNMAAYHTQQAIEKIIKTLLVKARGFAGTEHDLAVLITDAKALGIDIPRWADDNSYEISRWATTIRYNSNFKTNRDSIVSFNSMARQWIEEIRA